MHALPKLPLHLGPVIMKLLLRRQKNRKMIKGEAHLGPGWSDKPDCVGFKPLEVHDQAGATLPAPPPPGKLAGVPPQEQVLRLLGGSGHHHPAPVSPHCHKAGARGWAGFIVSEDIPYQGFQLCICLFPHLQTLQWHTITCLGASWHCSCSSPHLQVVTTSPPCCTLLLSSCTLSSWHLHHNKSLLLVT